MTLRRIRKLLGIIDDNDEGRFDLGDAARLEAAFPGCTAALDLNGRIGSWAGFTLRLEEAWLLRRRGSHVPEAGWGGVLVASRTTESGTSYVTPNFARRFPGESVGFVERAVYTPSEERWTVIR